MQYPYLSRGLNVDRIYDGAQDCAVPGARGSRHSECLCSIEHGAVDILRKKHGLTAEAAVEKVLRLVSPKSAAGKSVD